MPSIKHLSTLEQLSEYRQQRSGCVGFVPTMGNLHAGHLALVEEAAKHCDEVIVSIFVNPEQFSPEEDYEQYPRTLEKDLALLGNTSCSAVFTPSITEVYPTQINPAYDLSSYRDIEPLAKVLCGQSRPHFFYGVVKVVCRLFEMVQPDYACFGEKDYQQLLILTKVSQHLFPKGTILPVATQRNEKQLAMSSRNHYLSVEQLDTASMLAYEMQNTIQQIKASVFQAQFPQGTNQQWQQLLNEATKRLEQYFSIDYFEIRHQDDLQLIASFNETNPSIDFSSLELNKLRLFAAVYYNHVRLIDNWQLL